MRLTLRTLLAWLDDTLSPAEVREIGKQVAESPFAKELVERVHRVTRQRRLTVPSRSGPDSTDPNLVASYLDNELPPEEVAEFEKRCLTSDVHLAEVASVHQVLSLIGQKAKVPTEARHRMYHLIKGRESVAPKAPRASLASEPEPVSEPIQPWVTPEPPRQNWFGRFFPAAAILLLIILFCWSAWMSLTPVTDTGVPSVALAPDAEKAQPSPAKPNGDQALATEAEQANAITPAASEAVPDAEAESGTAGVAVKKDEGPDPSMASPAPTPTVTAPTLPSGGVGRVEKPAGILLRYNSERRDWDQVTAEISLKEQDRLLNLAPLRSELELSGGRIDLVAETEVIVLPAASDHAGAFELIHGRVVLKGATPAVPFAIHLGKKTVEVTPPAGGRVGVERLDHRAPGSAFVAGSALRVFAPEEEVALHVDDEDSKLSGPGSITLEEQGEWTEPDKNPVPNWVTEDRPSPYELQLGEQLQRYFRPGQNVLANLVEALEDDQKEVRRLAIAATRSAGGVALIVPLLRREENPVSRRAAIAVLRDRLGEGPEAGRELNSQLETNFGAEMSERVEKLLIGFTPKEVGDEATYKTLVDDLSSPEVAIRELALESLQTLTGRDNLGYDPDHPTGKGLTAWKNLANSHSLQPAAGPRAKNGQTEPDSPSEK